MVMAGHDNECQQFVSLASKVKKRVLNNFCQTIVGEVSDGTAMVEQFVGAFEDEFVFLGLPVSEAHSVGEWLFIQLLSIGSNLIKPRRGKAARKTSRHEERMPFHINVGQVPPTDDRIFVHVG